MADLAVKATLEGDTMKRLVGQLSDKRFRQAMSVGMNASARQVQAQTSRVVSKQMGVQQKRVRRSITIKPYASPGSLTATIRGSGKRLPLFEFKAKQVPAGVKASAWGKAKVYDGAFLATMASGHQGVFKRNGPKRKMISGTYKGKMRQPIEELWGPGIASTMLEQAISAQLVEYGEERMLANLNRQLERYAFSQGRRGA